MSNSIIAPAFGAGKSSVVEIPYILKHQKYTIYGDIENTNHNILFIRLEAVMIKYIAKLLRLKRRRTPDAPMIWLYPGSLKQQ